MTTHFPPAAAILLGLAATATLVQAQQVEEITVTAQKREQAISDVSLTVDAFSGDQARSVGIEKPQDVAFLIANVDIKGSAQGEANPAITVRGIGMNNFNSNNNQSVGVYVNEVFLSSPGMMSLSMMDIERIEVLKGPQGTLYGRNSSGGAINIISEKPSQELDGFASITLGDYQKTRFEGALGGGFSDTVSGRVSVLYDRQGESWHTNALTGDDFGDSDNLGIRGQLLFEGEKTSVLGSLAFMNQDVQNRPFTHFGLFDGALSFNFCTPAAAGNLDNSQCVDVLGYMNLHGDDGFTHDFQTSRIGELRADSDVVNATIRIDHDFETMTLTSVTGYIDQDRTYGENTWSQPAEFFAVVHDEEIDQFSQELRLAGDTDRANWVAGVFYSKDNIEAINTANSGDIFGALLGVSPVTWDFDQETTALALFGNVDWLLSDTLTLVTGLRYTDEEVDFVGATDGFDIASGTTFEFVGTDDTFSDENVTFRTALELRPNDDFLGYASISSGFKSGGFNGDFIIDPTGYDPFDSETVLSYEVGGKATIAGGRAQIDAAVFYYDYEDIQTIVPATPPNPGFQLGNLDSADIWGIDLDIAGAVTDNLDLRLGLGYLDTEVSDSRAGYDGAELPNAPEFQVTAGARYEIPLANDWLLALQGDIKYADSAARTVPNSDFGMTDSYTILNLRVALEPVDGQWELAAFAHNAADEEYFIEAFEVFDPLGATAKLAGPPRIWGVSFNYRVQ